MSPLLARAVAGIDLRLSPGRHAAVVGPSGPGKSSLVNLALRFWIPDEGVIRSGGIPLDQLRAFLPSNGQNHAV